MCLCCPSIQSIIGHSFFPIQSLSMSQNITMSDKNAPCLALFFSLFYLFFFLSFFFTFSARSPSSLSLFYFCGFFLGKSRLRVRRMGLGPRVLKACGRKFKSVKLVSMVDGCWLNSVNVSLMGEICLLYSACSLWSEHDWLSGMAETGEVNFGLLF